MMDGVYILYVDVLYHTEKQSVRICSDDFFLDRGTGESHPMTGPDEQQQQQQQQQQHRQTDERDWGKCRAMIQGRLTMHRSR